MFTVHLFTTLRTFQTTPYLRVNFLTRKRDRYNVITVIGLAKPFRSHILTRIKYKLAYISYSCLSTNCPPYLADSLQLHSSTDSSVVHLSVQYHMVKGLSHTPPLLLSTLFLGRSALLILFLLSNLELKLTFSVSPFNSLNVSVVICVFSFRYQLCCSWVRVLCVFSMFCNCTSVL